MDTPAHPRLRSDLSYCLIDGHAIFLDVDGDRYFRLPTSLETAFLAWVSRGECTASTLRGLVDCGVLDDSLDPSFSPPRRTAEPPMRSALEMGQATRFFSASVLFEVGTLVASTHRQLRTRLLKDILDNLPARPAHDVVLNDTDYGVAADSRLVAAAQTFVWTRAFVPIETVCLLDSIALVRFLARRDLHASIVMGVTCDPFEAHCWVQAGDLLLNETVGDACMYTPIKVVP